MNNKGCVLIRVNIVETFDLSIILSLFISPCWRRLIYLKNFQVSVFVSDSEIRVDVCWQRIHLAYTIHPSSLLLSCPNCPQILHFLLVSDFGLLLWKGQVLFNAWMVGVIIDLNSSTVYCGQYLYMVFRFYQSKYHVRR